ncbi:hypothetical protein IE077_003669 [Cardiosporidium cionae]|uniref:AP2/ERF domain-containing protein n=1 Tax=Cardiosporidium cionae TaxID=476202 RepID=A0ABQ7JES6_9APIC|nr:hypothetical protein IE077_003669 [Cardiosporidium cionae]|eukprot:KAF8822483.1 hypothetical protein IE077_003669 [Cardiosporidium cionae]
MPVLRFAAAAEIHPKRAYFQSQIRHSSHLVKPPSREVFHPYIAAPEHLPPPPCFRANLNPMQAFIPNEYRRQIKLEAVRPGDYLGKDFPWNFLRKWRDWRRRKYNCSYQTIPWMISEVKGVNYNEKLNCWSTQWHENGSHRIRQFRAAFGILKAKESAEEFRRKLEASGRVDNRRTERQMRMQYIAKKAEKQLRKKRFAKVSSGQL